MEAASQNTPLITLNDPTANLHRIILEMGIARFPEKFNPLLELAVRRVLERMLEVENSVRAGTPDEDVLVAPDLHYISEYRVGRIFLTVIVPSQQKALRDLVECGILEKLSTNYPLEALARKEMYGVTDFGKLLSLACRDGKFRLQGLNLVKIPINPLLEMPAE